MGGRHRRRPTAQKADGRVRVEDYFTNHQYSAKERQKLQQFESTEYLPENNVPFRQFTLRMNPDPTRRVDKWFIMVLIGLAVGLVGFLLHQLIEALSGLKYKLVDHMLESSAEDGGAEGGTGGGLIVRAWLAYLSVSVSLAVASAAVVLVVSPAAAGSGIPQVIAHLNGTVVPEFLTLKTFLAKLVSCVLAVSSGLFVGPEGPMIAMGAVLGRGISGMQSKALGFDLGAFRRLRNPTDRRDFVSAGAGAGVASAFGAPVGGLLFTMEECSSFWQPDLTWQIFFACMLASLTTNCFNAAAEGEGGSIGGVIFQVAVFDVNYHILMCVPALLLGIIGGFLGGLFTLWNLRISRFRNAYINPSRIRRVVEVVVIALLASVVVVVLPAAFGCAECKVHTKNEDGGSGKCFENDKIEMHRYTCPEGFYNPLASLYLQTGHETIKRLFTRETFSEFGYGSLLTLLATYFPLACWSAGTVLSSGIVVPMLLIGATYGRILGVVFNDLFGETTEGDMDWVDPGVFALIGAASFFGGVSRLTMSLTVIMMELSMDVKSIVPIMLSVVTAKSIADRITHSMYHALIEQGCLPFLDHIPGSKVSLDVYPVSILVDGQRIVSVGETCTIAELRATLASNSHNAFAVVDVDGHFKGSVRRDTVRAIIDRAPRHPSLADLSDSRARRRSSLLDRQAAASRGRGTATTAPTTISSAPLDEYLLDGGGGSGVADATTPASFVASPDMRRLEGSEAAQQRVVPYEILLEKRTDNVGLNRGGSDEDWVDIHAYTNTSAEVILADHSIERAYSLFRAIGARHVFVLDNACKPVGVLTKKDLLGHFIEEKIEDVDVATWL